MAKSEPTSRPTDAPATASFAAPPVLNGIPATPTAAFSRPEPVHAGGPHLLGTETALPATAETDVDPSPHLPQIPGYHILRTIGGGGMGTVFKAVQLGLNRVVALKLINSGWAADNDFRQRFDREVKTLASLDHPNIVPVYDAGSWQGLLYLTMKFVPGKTLYHRLETVRREPRAAARLVAQVARAVHYLHSQGIIHRDLKPLNILLTADGTPLVADFGLVRPIADDTQLSISLVPLGTRQYMSPEQTRGGRENYTTACDIWALGVILYEVLAGRRPFGHDDPCELFRMIRSEPVPPVPIDRGVPPGLEAVARKCLQKAPADRYPTAEAVAADLERWLAGEALVADPLPASQPATRAPTAIPEKNPQRSRVLFTAGAVAAVAAVVAWGSGAFRDKPPDRPTGPTARTTLPHVERTPLERFAAGEPIALTDAKGKPTADTVLFPGHPVGWWTKENGYHVFSSRGAGVVEMSAVEFPRPLRIEADVAVIQGDFELLDEARPGMLVAVYAGRKDWLGQLPMKSLVWAGAAYGFVRDVPGVQVIRSVGRYWWAGEYNASPHRLDSRPVPRDEHERGSDGPHFVRVRIDVRDEEIATRVGDGGLEPVKGQDFVNALNLDLRVRPKLQPYKFAAPAFGPGIGLFLHKANGVVANLTVSKLNP